MTIMTTGANKDFRIDYIQFGCHRYPHFLIGSIDDYRKRSNKAFYDRMTIFANGVIMYEGNVNTDKKLFVMSGKVCEEQNVDRAWVESLIFDGGIVSRLDLAMTTDVNILTLIQRDHEYAISQRYTKYQVIADIDYTPQTIYVGDFKSRKRKGIYRAYDKGLQLGLDVPMYRMELELKQKDAHIASRRYASGDTIPSIMSSKYRIDRDWYKDLFGDDIATMRFATLSDPGQRHIDNKMDWLERQVIPSLQYVIDYDHASGEKNFERLINLLKFKG